MKWEIQSYYLVIVYIFLNRKGDAREIWTFALYRVSALVI
jgi:hypothetical protein